MQTPLFLAAENGRKEVLVEPILAGATTIDVVNWDEWTPLQIASENGHGGVVCFLCVISIFFLIVQTAPMLLVDAIGTSRLCAVHVQQFLFLEYSLDLGYSEYHNVFIATRLHHVLSAIHKEFPNLPIGYRDQFDCQ